MQLASVDDKADYKTVNEAIKQIGFTKQATSFWQIVAAVIHLVSSSPTSSMRPPSDHSRHLF